MKAGKFLQIIKSEEASLDYIRKKQWGRSVKCGNCGNKNLTVYKTKGAIKKYRCKKCSHIFSDISKTEFKKTKIPLNIYFKAVSMLSFGISIRKIAEALNVNPKTILKIKSRAPNRL